MLWPKKNHTRNLITKENSYGSKIPQPPPHNFSNGLSLSISIETICPEICIKLLARNAKSPLPVAVRFSKTPLLTGDVKMYLVSQNKNVTSVRRRRVCFQWFYHTLMSCV